jgi:O-antigen/teichoic acid export membrane protein
MVALYADRWILQSLAGEREVGMYVALYQIANAPIALTVGVINQFLVPIIFDVAGEVRTSEQRVRSGYLVDIGVGLAATIFFLAVITAYGFSERLVRLLTAEEYVTQHFILWIIVLGLSLFHIGQMFVTKGLSQNAPGRYLVAKLVHALATVVGAWLLGRRYGAAGIAEALCLAAGLYLLTVLWVNRRLQRELLQ